MGIQNPKNMPMCDPTRILISWCSENGNRSRSPVVGTSCVNGNLMCKLQYFFIRERGHNFLQQMRSISQASKAVLKNGQIWNWLSTILQSHVSNSLALIISRRDACIFSVFMCPIQPFCKCTLSLIKKVSDETNVSIL